MLLKKVWPKVNLSEVVTHLAMRCLYWGWGPEGVRGLGARVHMIKGCPAQSSTKLGHKMSLHRGRVEGGVEMEGVKRWGVWAWGWGHLTKAHPAQSSAKLGHNMSLLGTGALGVAGCRGRRVHLTKGQPAPSSTKLGHKMSEWGGGRVLGGSGD